MSNWSDFHLKKHSFVSKSLQKYGVKEGSPMDARFSALRALLHSMSLSKCSSESGMMCEGSFIGTGAGSFWGEFFGTGFWAFSGTFSCCDFSETFWETFLAGDFFEPSRADRSGRSGSFSRSIGSCSSRSTAFIRASTSAFRSWENKSLTPRLSGSAI